MRLWSRIYSKTEWTNVLNRLRTNNNVNAVPMIGIVKNHKNKTKPYVIFIKRP